MTDERHGARRPLELCWSVMIVGPRYRNIAARRSIIDWWTLGVALAAYVLLTLWEDAGTTPHHGCGTDRLICEMMEVSNERVCNHSADHHAVGSYCAR